jgi:hypothetical protein
VWITPANVLVQLPIVLTAVETAAFVSVLSHFDAENAAESPIIRIDIILNGAYIQSQLGGHMI